MAMPRMAALAEVLWTPAARRAYAGFQSRLLRHFALLDHKGVNYSRSIYQITPTMEPLPSGGGVLVSLSSPLDSSLIHYTTDGSSPTTDSPRYAGPIPVTTSGTLKFTSIKGDKILGPPAAQTFVITKSTGKSVRLRTQPDERYPGEGPSTLVNGVLGNPVRHGLHWIGFWGPDLDAVVDLGAPTPFSKVSMDFYDGEGSWIYLPKSVEILVSGSGDGYSSVKRLSADEIRAQGGKVTIDLGAQTARFVKVVAVNAGTIPAGKQGSGNPAWLFIDEIMIE
jgi:hexosaminidase